MDKADLNASLLNSDELKNLSQSLPGWDVVYKEDMPTLSRMFHFDNFEKALIFTNKVGEAAEAADHHPRICLTWGEAKVEWWSHSAGGVTQNDVNMAKATESCFDS